MIQSLTPGSRRGSGHGGSRVCIACDKCSNSVYFSLGAQECCFFVRIQRWQHGINITWMEPRYAQVLSMCIYVNIIPTKLTAEKKIGVLGTVQYSGSSTCKLLNPAEDSDVPGSTASRKCKGAFVKSDHVSIQSLVNVRNDPGNRLSCGITPFYEGCRFGVTSLVVRAI